MIGIQLACVLLSLGKVFLGISQLLLREGQVLLPVPYLYAGIPLGPADDLVLVGREGVLVHQVTVMGDVRTVSYTHLTLPTTPYV